MVFKGKLALIMKIVTSKETSDQVLSFNIGLNGKFLRLSNEKSIIFLIYLQYLISYIISIACYYRHPKCHKLLNSGLIETAWFAYAISSETQKLSV
jgi:hypothetical protein